MKKIVKIAILTVVVAVCAAMATACNKVESINIKNANMPNQLVYVVGSDLNLSGGTLTVVGKKETTLVELENPEVTISGYDKNKIGKQEVTVSYEGKTTTFSVTVVPRMVAENIVLDYFTGDDFSEKGRLKITKDDGTSFTVSLADEAITVSGFDSSVAKSPLEVTATYNANGESYVGTFNVNIYDVSETDFKAPTQKEYLSHAEGINLDGGYFTIKGGKAGELTRYVELEESMISGFDLSAATIENMETPLSQKVTVTYSGNNYYYDIAITYTNVTFVKNSLAKFEEIDWNGETLPEISILEGEDAVAVWNAYSTLSEEEKALFTLEEKLMFVRPASVYCYNVWVREVTAFPDAFSALVNGPQLTCKSYDATLAAYNVLSDPESLLNYVGDIIADINAEFGNESLLGDNPVSSLVSIVYSAETIANLAGYMNYLLNLYDFLDDVPANWTVETLSNYSQQINQALEFIANGDFATNANATFYDCVSSWRENKDFIEILYSYYYYVEKNDEAIALLKNLRLPGELENLYSAIMGAMSEITSMVNNKQPSSTVFMLYYDMALDSIDKINSSEDEMCKYLYENLTFEGLLTIGGEPTPVPFSTLMLYIETTNGGYVYHTNALYQDEVFNEMWDLYFTVLYGIMEGGEEYLDSEQCAKDIEAGFKYFVEMSPSWQYGYLISLHTYYRSGTPKLALDVMTEGMFSLFVEYSAEYYYFALPEGGAREVFTELLLALEYYSRRSVLTDGLSNFLAKMYSATTKYKLLSDADRAAFDSKLDFFYNKYVDIYEKYEDVNNPTTTELGEWKNSFDAMEEAVYFVNVAYNYISNEEEFLPIYVALLSSCERAMSIAAEIKANAPANILAAYNNEAYVTLLDDRKVTLEFGEFFAKNVFNNFLRSNSVYDVYTQSTELRAFIKEGFAFFWTTLYYDEEEAVNFTDAEYVYALMASYRALSDKDKQVFYIFDIAIGNYTRGLNLFFEEQLTEKAASVAKLIVNFEQSYVRYISNKEGSVTDSVTGTTITNKEMLKNAMNALTTAYAALTGEDLTSFNNKLKDVYDYYVELYNKIDFNTPIA